MIVLPLRLLMAGLVLIISATAAHAQAWPPEPPRKPPLVGAPLPQSVPESRAAPVRQPRMADQLPRLAQRVQVISFKGSTETGMDATRRALLNAIAGEMQASPARRLFINSFADEAKGGSITARRRALSRAEAARDHLVAQGLDKHRMIIVSRLAENGSGDAERIEMVIVP